MRHWAANDVLSPRSRPYRFKVAAGSDSETEYCGAACIIPRAVSKLAMRAGRFRSPGRKRACSLIDIRKHALLELAQGNRLGRRQQIRDRLVAWSNAHALVVRGQEAVVPHLSTGIG